MDRSGFAITLMAGGRAWWRAGWRRAGWIVFSLVLACVAGPVPQALAEALYEVRDVRVDETDQTATAAREKALALGERRAWDILVGRLADPQQRRPLPEFPQREIGDAVQDFWVTQEKTSSVRYIATLNYTFRPERVRRLLSSRGVRFTAMASPLQVVVPVLETDAGRKLWDEPNPWRAIWHGLPSPWLTPLRVPSGDLADLAAITAEQAASADPQRLGDLARRYDTTDALVAIATLTAASGSGGSGSGGSGSGGSGPVSGAAVSGAAGSGPAAVSRELRVRGIRVTLTGNQELPERTYAFAGIDPPDETLRQGAEALTQDLEAAWRRGASEGGGSARAATRTVVRIPAAGIDDWVGLRRRLEAIPQVGPVRLISLSPRDAQVQIVYAGSTDQLTTALGEKGLALRDEGGEWVLSPGVAMAPPLIPDAVPPAEPDAVPPAEPDAVPPQ